MPSYFTSTDFTAAVRSGYDNASIHEVAVGDFNGDGNLDFVLTYFLYPLEDRATPIRLFIGDGHGGFTDQTSAFFPAGAPQTVHARETVVADFNGDGRADLFIADHGYDTNPFPGAQNALFLSSGASGLTNAVGALPQLRDYSHSAEAADIDGDGDKDIFVGNGGGGTAYVKPYFLVNDGAGGFTRTDAGLPASVLNGTNHWSEAFLDVDRDGDLDLFLGASKDYGAQLLLNNGHGVFSASPVAMPAGVSNADAVDIQTLDVNRDGLPDLMVAYSAYDGGGDPQREIQLLVNDGAGGFVNQTADRLPASIQEGVWSRRVHLVDVNGDGYVDMVLSDHSATPVYLNDGTGHFIGIPSPLPGNEYDQITPGDFNGDGRIDFMAWRGKWDGMEQMRVDLGVDPGLTQNGTAAAEGLWGDNDAEHIYGGDGGDTLIGGGGEDYLRGEEGDDRIAGGDGFDDVHGNMGNDTVSGGEGPDWVVGGKDNDVLYGDGDHDVVLGNMGADTVMGGVGNDVVRGGKDDDVVKGEEGDDWISGDRGTDTLTGGSGADSFHVFDGSGTDRVTDFSVAEGDRVYLLPGTHYTVAQSGADTVVTVTDGEGGQLILAGVQMSTLPDGWIFGA